MESDYIRIFVRVHFMIFAHHWCGGEQITVWWGADGADGWEEELEFLWGGTVGVVGSSWG